MGFRTKLDFSNNRQVKQQIETITVLSGATSFGVPFSALPTGGDSSTSAITESYSVITSYFSGNNTTTNYTWFDPRMSLGEPYLSALTPSTSATTQNTGQVYVPVTSTVIDGNTVNLTYTGVSFDIFSVSMTDLGGGNYSGSVTSLDLFILSANGLDFTGRTIWNDVSGITRTNRLIVTNNPQLNHVLTCIDAEGMAEWGPATFTGNTSATCITDIYTTNLYGCSPLHIDPSGLNDVYIVENGGNVGIGTTSPTSKLHVSGNTYIQGDVDIIGNVNIVGSATTLNTQTVQSKDNKILLNYSGNNLTAIGGGIEVLSAKTNGNSVELTTDANGDWNSNTGLNITGRTDDNTSYGLNVKNSGGTSNFVVRNDSRVGINTDSPEYTFDFVSSDGKSKLIYQDAVSNAQNVQFSGDSTVMSQLAATSRLSSLPLLSIGNSIGIIGENNTGFPGYGNPLDGFIYNSANANRLNIISAPTLAIGTNTDDIRFYAGQFVDSGFGSDMHINGSGANRGFVGIGTESPTEKLHVSGNTKISGGLIIDSIGSGTSLINLGLDSNGNVVSGTTGSTSYWSASTGTNAIVVKNSGSIASGLLSLAEGFQTTASGISSHAEGQSTVAGGLASHVEGSSSSAMGTASHAEGAQTTAIGSNSHSEGNLTIAIGLQSHAEGQQTTASGTASHAEGQLTIAIGFASHAEGNSTTANGNQSHAEGNGTRALDFADHAEGEGTTASGTRSHAEGYFTQAIGYGSHSEGGYTTATVNYAHAEGHYSTASGIASHAEGGDMSLGPISGKGGTAIGDGSHAEGLNTTSIGLYSHAEGAQTTAIGQGSHSEGTYTTAVGNSSHAGGLTTIAQGNYSFVHGQNSVAIGSSTIVLGANITGNTDNTLYVKNISILSGATNGFVLVSDASGNATWQSASGATSGSTFWSASTGTNSIVVKNSGSLASGGYALAEGFITTAQGQYSHAEGSFTQAIGVSSHAEGNTTTASGNFGSHAEGDNTTASGQRSHAEGFLTTASGNQGSHAEGSSTIASGNASHAEGGITIAGGNYSHAEGLQTTAKGDYSHAEGQDTVASGTASHAEGGTTTALGVNSHAEGKNTKAIGDTSHAEGDATTALGDTSHAEGRLTTANGSYSHAEGNGTKAINSYSHSEGFATTASGTASHAEGSLTTAIGLNSHAEGVNTKAFGDNSHAEGESTTAFSDRSHSEGFSTSASGDSSHAEGYQTKALNFASHSEGYLTTCDGYSSHAEGYSTEAIGWFGAHAEGNNTIASGVSSHAEGISTTAGGIASHAEGASTTAIGLQSHAGGENTIASGDYSFVHGRASVAQGDYSIVLGRSITGTTNDTTYVDYLNINNVLATAFLNDIRIDANGNLTTNTSDERLKENITPLTGALDKIKNLQGVTYQWKDRNAGGDAVRLGFIAQQVEAVEPLLVFTSKTEEQYKGLHTDGIIPLLVEAIKELSSGVTQSNNTYLETQTILAEDNNIDLNYSGTPETALGGGLRVLHAKGQDISADFITDSNGDFVTNNDFKPNALTIPYYTPTSSSDIVGNEGNITRDDDYLYIKTSTGWKRSNLESF